MKFIYLNNKQREILRKLKDEFVSEVKEEIEKYKKAIDLKNSLKVYTDGYNTVYITSIIQSDIALSKEMGLDTTLLHQKLKKAEKIISAGISAEKEWYNSDIYAIIKEVDYILENIKDVIYDEYYEKMIRASKRYATAKRLVDYLDSIANKS